jgi:hypothetical protein
MIAATARAQRNKRPGVAGALRISAT